MAESDKNTGATVAEVMDEAAHGGSGEAAAHRGPAGTPTEHDGAAGMDQAGHGPGSKVGDVLRESGDVGSESPSGPSARGARSGQDMAGGMDDAGKGRAE